jgi:hypothetical protein
MTFTIANEVGVRVACIGCRLIPGFTGSFTSFHEEGTDVACLESHAVNGCQFNALLDSTSSNRSFDGLG